MNKTSEILDKIDKEMSKMLGKSKNKMTDEEFRAFVTEKWEEMSGDKYEIHDAYILIGRMINEAIWAKDPKDLVKWIKENQKHQSALKNNINVLYDSYKSYFIECKAIAEAVDFYKSESNSEAIEYVAYFQNIVDNPQVLEEYLNEMADDFDEDDFGFQSVELKQWQAFFGEEEAEIGYEILRKDGETTDRENKNHKNGLEYLKNNQKQVLNAILGELLEQYPSIQERYKEFYSEDEKIEFMPNITDIKGFAELLSPTSIFVFSEYQDDIPYIGIDFHCMWEQEHGLGVVICKDRVIAIGSADIAFDIHTVKDDVKAQKKRT